jgi:hypothetical protein
MIIGTGTISKSTINIQLSQKYAQLHALDQKASLEKTSQNKQDYIEVSGQQLDKNDYERVLAKFKSADSHIRAHEQNHASHGTTTAPIQYNYQMGPDGKMYAVGGSVRLDTSIPDDPKAAQIKLDQIKRSANTNSDPSGADIGISSEVNIMKARLQFEETKKA